MNKEYLTVKEAAEELGVTTQYIYKILNSVLKPYKKKISKKTYIDAEAIEKLKNEKFATDLQPSKNEDLQPKEPTIQPTLQPKNNDLVAKNDDFSIKKDEFATDLQPRKQKENADNEPTLQPNQENRLQNGEVEALKALVKELQEQKQELLKDKEYLKQEALKWQQLLIDERNKVKLLEAAAEPREQEIEYTEIREAAAAAEPQQEPTEPQPQPRTFKEKIKWLFTSNK